MAARIGSLFVSLVADMSAFQPDMQRAAAITRSTSSQMRRDVGLTEKSVRSLGQSGGGFSRNFDTRAILTASRSFDTMNSRVSLLRGTLLATTSVFGGLGAALGANVLSRYADQFTGLQNQLRVVSKDTADLQAQTQALVDVSNRARVSLGATATLYSRIAKASPGEGPERTLRRVETIQKALALGGATAAETYSASIQLSQGLASDRLGGEELRAVLETPLGLELARGLNMTIGQFREAGHAGRLTARMIYESLDKIGASVDGQFANSISTIDQALAVLDNNLTTFVGNTDKAYGVSRAIAGGIGSVATNLETLIPLLAAAGGLMASSFVGNRIGAAGVGVVGRARAEVASRRDAAAAAREAQAQAEAAYKQSAGSLWTAERNAFQPDQKQFAEPSVLKAYQRDLTAVQKLDAERVNLLGRQSEAVRKLGEQGRSVTPAMVTAAQNIRTAEAAVSAELANQQTIRRAIDSQGTRLNAMLGQQATFTGSTQGLTKLKSDIAAAEQVLARSREDMQQSERRFASESVALAGLRAADSRGISQQIAKSLNEEDAARNALVANETARTAAVERLRQSGVVAANRGAAATTAALDEQVQATRRVSEALVGANRTMEQTARQASRTGIAMSAMRAGGASLTSFLGGPWGIAFAAASAGMFVLGKNAQEAATRNERLKQEMRSLGLIAEETDGKIRGAASALGELRAVEIREQRRQATDRLAELRGRSSVASRVAYGPSYLGDVSDSLRGQLGRRRGNTPDQRATLQQLQSVVDRLKDGTIEADEFARVMDKIGEKDMGEGFDDLLTTVREVGEEMIGLFALVERGAASLANAGASVNYALARSAEDASMKALGGLESRGQQVVDEELRVSKLDDRAREIEQAAATLAKAITDAGGYISNADATLRATQIVDNREFQTAISGGIFELIRKVEGTGPGTRGYNETLANGKFTGGDVNLVNMTLNEVLQLQKRMLAHPENSYNSSAVGAYQIVSKTLRGLMSELGLKGDELFDEGMQDRMAQQLLRGRGRNATGLGNEWQGIQFALRDGKLTEEQLYRAYDASSNGLGNMDEEVRRRNEDANQAILDIEADKQNAYRETMASLREETALINLETFMIGESAAAKEREVLIQETINRLKADGVAITDQVVASVRAEAEARFTAAQAAEAQELSHEQLIEKMDDLRSLSGSVMSGFLSDIRDGKGLLDSLASALDKIADKIFDVFTDNFVTSMFGKKGDAGGGFLGSFLSGGAKGGGLLGGILIPGILHEGGRVGLHGMGKGRRVSAGAFAGAPRFHSGLTSKEFPTILEKGERVLTARQEAKTAGVIAGLSAQAVASGAGPRVVINDQRTSSTAEQVEVRQSDDGRQLEVFVRDLARDEVTTPGRGANQALRRGFGLSKGLVIR